MNQFLTGLGMRERVLLGAGVVLLTILLLYVFAWRPLDERVERLHVTVGEQLALHHWMEAAAQEVRRLRAGQGGQRTERQSLLSMADRTAREGGLGPAIRRVEPEGTDRVRIVLEQAGFDDMVSWLELLVSRYQVRVENVTVDARNEAGMVNARLILQASSP